MGIGTYSRAADACRSDGVRSCDIAIGQFDYDRSARSGTRRLADQLLGPIPVHVTIMSRGKNVRHSHRNMRSVGVSDLGVIYHIYR